MSREEYNRRLIENLCVLLDVQFPPEPKKVTGTWVMPDDPGPDPTDHLRAGDDATPRLPRSAEEAVGMEIAELRRICRANLAAWFEPTNVPAVALFDRLLAAIARGEWSVFDSEPDAMTAASLVNRCQYWGDQAFFAVARDRHGDAAKLLVVFAAALTGLLATAPISPRTLHDEMTASQGGH